MRALVFPGQGSQEIGMGMALAESFPAAREIFAEIDDALNQNLSRMMFSGDESDLGMTENTQPAIMAVGMAALRVLETEAGFKLTEHADYVAGHSLGEYTALCASGAISLADTARLLKLRGQAMQRAVPAGIGAMAALLGLDFETAKQVAQQAAEAEICQAANDNAPGQVVVSGHLAAVERAIALSPQFGGKKGIRLPVSAPFHCSLMQPAADIMAKALAETILSIPHLPVVANISAEAVSSPDEIRALLVQQVTGTVRWRESVEWMKQQGVTECFELGHNKVLAGLIKRIDKEIQVFSVGTPHDIDAIANRIG